MIRREDITAVILAGGRGRRMEGADKGLLTVQGRPLIRYVIDAVQPQVGTVIISANRHEAQYAVWGFPVLSDHDGDFAGPLAGIARVLGALTTPYLLVVPCDMPFLPAQLVEGLAKALLADNAQAAVVRAAGYLQPLCVLLRREVEQDLHRFRASDGAKVQQWLRRLRHVVVDFPEQSSAFCNINTPADLAAISFI
jgi:molybdopterin-guanine dinucleotide biosynthesis protein A